MAKYRVFEHFTVCLISEVKAENEEAAIGKHIIRTTHLSSDALVREEANGSGDSEYEVEKID